MIWLVKLAGDRKISRQKSVSRFIQHMLKGGVLCPLPPEQLSMAGHKMHAGII